MKKSLLVRLAFLILTASALSSCIWWVDEEGRHRGEHHEREHGEHHENRDDHR